MVVSNVNTA